MRLDGYLTEKYGSKKIDNKKLIALLNKNCSAAYNCKTKIYRGIDSYEKFLFVDPSKVERRSPYASNDLYMQLLSNLPSWSKYPKRNRSISCSSGADKADRYGNSLYIVYPFDGADIGVCPTRDLWQAFEESIGIHLNHMNEKIYFFLDDFLWIKPAKREKYSVLLKYFDELDEKKRGWFEQKIKKTRYEILEDHFTYEDREFINRLGWLKDKDVKFIDCLNKVLDPERNDFELVKAGTTIRYKDRELWTDAPCLLVRSDYEIE